MSRFTRFMFVMAALLLMTSSAFAYDVRYETLGGVPYWKDAGDVNMWYGEIANYGDMVWMNFDGFFGNELNLAKNEDTFGTYFLSIGGDVGEKVGLGYGYSLDVVTLGFFFQMYENNADDKSVYDFGAGLDYDMDETNIDFSFMYGKSGDDSDMGFGVRAFYPWKDGVEVIPAFMYESASFGDNEASGMAFGLGFAYTVNDDNTLILGFDYMKETATIASVDYEDTVMPGFYLGMEHDVNDWLTVRASGYKAWLEDIDGDADPVETFPFTFTFGFGIHLGDFDLDVMYDESQIFDTFNWFMGGPDGLGVTALQIKYYF